MLISPPFLPQRQSSQKEDDWLMTAMVEGGPGDGAYPVSFNLGWHGGVHLTAPLKGTTSEPVRAIADGTVVFKRLPTPKTRDENHPLNYRGGWTDDGCVVVRHETAIGAGDGASEIVFFSIYMHLSCTDAKIRNGGRVRRKQLLGQAGQIYGDIVRKIHFEIVSDEANAKKILGRLEGDLDITRNGRADAVFGEVYLHFPIGTPIYDVQPLPNLAVAHIRSPKKDSRSSLPPVVSLIPVFTTAQAMVVGLCTSPEDVSRSGDVIVKTYDLDGGLIGSALRENKSDYLVFKTATEISKSFPVGAKPAASAVIELLRFGRLINTENESLPTGGVPHWRRISYPGGVGWVDLNAANVTKFSDADFPHWAGWSIIDDAADNDSRCDSKVIKSWLSTGPGSNLDSQKDAAALRDLTVAKRLSKSVCKFPSEWYAATVDDRWGWLMAKSPTNPEPQTAENFAQLKAHITALCIDLPSINSAQWHWPPFQFVRHFRTCGWLSEAELVRCVPAAYQTERARKGSGIILSTISISDAQQRVKQRNSDSLMRVCRKYGIVTPLRMAHFFSQIYRETGVRQWVQERASGAEYEGRTDLGNRQVGDGVRFKGRGLIQTTGRKNYESYGEYRGREGTRSYTLEPNHLLLATDGYDCADAAGLYWISRAVDGGAININRVADRGFSENDLRAVTRNINGAEDGPWTGLVERRSHLAVLVAVLLDGIPNIAPAVEHKYE